VEISDDRRSATITLPHAHVFEPQLDVEESYVYDREQGAFNEIAGLFSEDANYQQELNRLAVAKLRDAAEHGSGLVPRAEENTRAMLESLLRSLGFTAVVVTFE
jgi:hypothetical protein